MMYPVGFSHITATGAVTTKAGCLSSIILTAGADAASIVLHDNPSAASGVKILEVKAALGTTTVVDLSSPLVYSKGLYATVTGTTPAITVGYY